MGLKHRLDDDELLQALHLPDRGLPALIPAFSVIQVEREGVGPVVDAGGGEPVDARIHRRFNVGCLVASEVWDYRQKRLVQSQFGFRFGDE